MELVGKMGSQREGTNECDISDDAVRDDDGARCEGSKLRRERLCLVYPLSL